MRLTSPLVLLITLCALSMASVASAATWWRDLDADNFGDPANSTESASQPPGYVGNNLDCNDTTASVHPGAPEVCNGVDDDCDGLVDEDAVDGAQWFADADADGFGDPTNMVVACVAPPGYVADGSDCDDTTASINPGAPEVCNGVDDDCDGLVDEGCVVGTDGVAPPDRLLLHHAVPNPMRGTVALAVDLPRAGHVRLAVYDARGALVRGLHDATREAGRFVAVWSGSDNEGRAVRPGVYYIRLKALGETQVRKVLLVE